MQIKSLGSTNLHVTPIGIGMAALGRPGYINLGHAVDLRRSYDVAAMQAHSHRVLDTAYEGGVRYFDAARSYGRAEQFLGSWLSSRAISPESVVVGSKWGYTYTAGWQVDAEVHEVKEHSSAVLLRQWSESQDNLGGYLKLYQIHSATMESGVLHNAEVHSALARLRDEGVAIGLTVSGPKQAETIMQALEIKIGGERLFACVQATWNLLERSAGAALESARQMGVGIIIKEALANGRLTERNREASFAHKMALLKAQSERLGTSVDALALAAALNQPWADVVLSGAARQDHLRSNLKALEVRWDAEAEAKLAELVEPVGEYWQIRSDLAWN